MTELPRARRSNGGMTMLIGLAMAIGGRGLARRLQAPPEGGVEGAGLAKWGPVADQIKAAGLPVTSLDARGPRHLPRVVRRLRTLVRERGVDTVFSFLVHANFVAALVS